jgi:hypothetical protein
MGEISFFHFFSVSVKRHAYTRQYIGVRNIFSGGGVLSPHCGDLMNMNGLQNIKTMIYKIRGYQVMLDADLAKIYQVETKRLNEAVKRNIGRFPSEFMFQLTKDEYENLMSQIATSSFHIPPLRSQFVTSKNHIRLGLIGT